MATYQNFFSNSLIFKTFYRELNFIKIQAIFIFLKNKMIYLFIYLFLWSLHEACGILVPQPGIEHTPPGLEAWRSYPLDHQGTPKLWVFDKFTVVKNCG